MQQLLLRKTRKQLRLALSIICDLNIKLINSKYLHKPHNDNASL